MFYCLLGVCFMIMWRNRILDFAMSDLTGAGSVPYIDFRPAGNWCIRLPFVIEQLQLAENWLIAGNGEFCSVLRLVERRRRRNRRRRSCSGVVPPGRSPGSWQQQQPLKEMKPTATSTTNRKSDDDENSELDDVDEDHDSYVSDDSYCADKNGNYGFSGSRQERKIRFSLEFTRLLLEYFLSRGLPQRQ